MRPDILCNLFQPVTALKGVGTATGKLFDRLAGPHVRDVLFHKPVGVTQREHVQSLSEATLGQTITIHLTAQMHSPAPARGRRPYRVHCLDEKGLAVDLVFFKATQDYILKQFPIGVKCMVSGVLDQYNNTWQMTHPDHIGTIDETKNWIGCEPIYPLTQGISNKYMNKVAKQTVSLAPALPEWINDERLKQMAWPNWQGSVQKLHHLESPEDIFPLSSHHRRLAYDELFANQLGLRLIRQHTKSKAGQSIQGDGRLRDKLTQIIPYTLTGAQQRASEDIAKDMASNARMVRLLQGDVGSGKTVVAMFAMLNAVEAGFQAALIAPTEILANQHIATLQPWADACGVKIGLLTGKSKSRKDVLDQLAKGELNIIIGTHAVIQEGVDFQNLGLAIIDEQHRFGVEQRLKLSKKGEAVDTLVMTATPIPRTLMMAGYGDLSSSQLDEKPAGRQEIDTKVISLAKLDDVVTALKRALAKGQKIYWVCPLVEESEVLDLAAAQDRFNSLQLAFPGKVALVHGKMKSAEKDEAMKDFVEGDVQILVATTVIEVGVHVSDATIMVIEHAERFGLSQLHQLRGRIGRGDLASTCLLLYGSPLTETATARLKIMRETNDGFKIAEEDYRLRGGGDVLGLRQSGMPDFRLANLDMHKDLLALAQKDAVALLDADPHLQSQQGQAAKVLLYLFEKDKAVNYLQSG